jgi:hypothetical protein
VIRLIARRFFIAFGHENVAKFVLTMKIDGFIHATHKSLIHIRPSTGNVHKKYSQYPKKARRECAQCCRQITINFLDIFREAIDDATQRRLIEKLHGRTENLLEKKIVRNLGSVQCSNVQ